MFRWFFVPKCDCSPGIVKSSKMNPIRFRRRCNSYEISQREREQNERRAELTSSSMQRRPGDLAILLKPNKHSISGQYETAHTHAKHTRQEQNGKRTYG